MQTRPLSRRSRSPSRRGRQPAGGSLRPATDVRLMIVPRPRSSMSRSARWVRWSGVSTLPVTTVLRAWGRKESNGSLLPSPVWIPLLTSRSIPPQEEAATSYASRAERQSHRSRLRGRARWPCSRILAAVDSRLPGMGKPSECSPSFTVRAVGTTSKPALASATQVAPPMPRLAPVTKATGHPDVSVVVRVLRAEEVGDMAACQSGAR